MLTNLGINSKNEVSFRWKKPLKHIFNNAPTEEFRSGAPKQPSLELLYIVMGEQCAIEKAVESVRVIHDNRSACHQEVIY